jgi:rhodanese-related sulfurtransferase
MGRVIDFRKHLLGIGVVLAFLVYLANVPTQSFSEQYHVKDVDTEQAKALVDNGALVIDVRGAEQFGYRHIPGAILVPLEELEKGIPSSLAKEKTRDILVYCNEGLAHGPEATALLNQAGFSRAVNLKGGIEGWAGAKMPIVSQGSG